MRNSKKEGGCGVFKILPVEVNTSLCGYSLTSCAKSVVEIERFLKKMQAFLIYIRGLDCVFRRKKIKKLANLNWLSNEIKITFYRMEVSYVYGLRDRSYLTFAIEYTPPGQKCSSWFAEKVYLYGITVRNNKKFIKKTLDAFDAWIGSIQEKANNIKEFKEEVEGNHPKSQTVF